MRWRWDLGGRKKSKNESSQNDELYSGKCAQTLGEYFGGTATLQNGHLKLKIKKHVSWIFDIFYFPIFPYIPLKGCPIKPR